MSKADSFLPRMEACVMKAALGTRLVAILIQSGPLNFKSKNVPFPLLDLWKDF